MQHYKPVNRCKKKKDLSQLNIRYSSVGWLTPDTARQTAKTAERVEPDLRRASAITLSNVSLAAVSIKKQRFEKYNNNEEANSKK